MSFSRLLFFVIFTSRSSSVNHNTHSHSIRYTKCVLKTKINQTNLFQGEENSKKKLESKVSSTIDNNNKQGGNVGWSLVLLIQKKENECVTYGDSGVGMGSILNSKGSNLFVLTLKWKGYMDTTLHYLQI